MLFQILNCMPIILIYISRFAFVTMTTVGYGDKVPRTIVGRIVAMIWSIIGIALISLITASLTTVLQEVIVGNAGAASIENNNMGVIADRIERHLVLREGGMPVGMPHSVKYLPRERIE